MRSLQRASWVIILANISDKTTKSAESLANSASDKHSARLQAMVERKKRLEQFFIWGTLSVAFSIRYAKSSICVIMSENVFRRRV